MGLGSKIEWTQATWNPCTGCDRISSGCKNCYAERLARRLQAMRQVNYREGFKLAIHEHMLDVPLRWSSPKTVFVNSMSDLFHSEVPLDFIQKVFSVMGQAHWHTFQVLTKRSSRLLELHEKLEWRPNIWMGVSVEDASYKYRIDHLKTCGARVKFLSLEPLLGRMGTLDLHGIDWVIVGGESGPGARPMMPDWAREIRDQCVSERVPFFFKQWGGPNKKRAGRLLDERLWDQGPNTPVGDQACSNLTSQTG